MSDAAVVALARDAGLEERWIDAGGRKRKVGIDTLKSVLQALNLPVETRADLAESRDRLVREREGIPPLIVARTGETVGLGAARSAELVLATGERKSVRLRTLPDGTRGFPAPIEPGYARIAFDGSERSLAVAPARCVQPQDLGAGARLCGLSAQIYALRGGSSGSFGDFAALGSVATRAGRLGFDAIMASPSHALFGADSARFAPYSPSTRLFLNPLFADTRLGGGPASQDPAKHETLIDWASSGPRKYQALREAFERFRRQKAPGDFERFCRAGGERLLAHALFEALDRKFRSEGIADSRRWPAQFDGPAASGVRDFAERSRDEIAYELYLQWLASRSAAAAQKAARRTMAIGIIADLAVGMDPLGSHAWSAPGELLAGLRVGAPPDIFNSSGQDWGLTALSPRAEGGFAAFVATLRAVMRHAGGVRIDHAMGLRRLWVLPAGASASEGVYLRYPRRELLHLIALESHRHRAIVVGEDLGTVPQGFRAELASAGILGMQVLWFERDRAAGFVDPRKWRRDAVATTTTHDLPTVAGWWRGRDIDWQVRTGHLRAGEKLQRKERASDRARLWTAMRRAKCAAGDEPSEDAPERAVAGALAFVGRARSPLALAPIEDIAGEVEQPNLPGTIDAHPNWRRRLPPGDPFGRAASRARIQSFLTARRRS